MLNQTGISRVSAGTRKTILYDTKLFFALSCKVGDAGVEEVNGKKIIKAGTPLKGSLNDRETAYEVTNSADDVIAILEHDVDVTKGTANGSALFFGFIDQSKLESDVVSKLTPQIKAAIPAIKFFD